MTQKFVILELVESKRIAFGNGASSGISGYYTRHEIPAFAGMTKGGVSA